MMTPREALERKAQPLFTFSEIPPYLRKRVIGLETEPSFTFKEMWYKDKKTGELHDSLRDYLDKVALGFTGLGGRTYRDTAGEGKRIEYASPETSNPFEAAIYDEALDFVHNEFLVYKTDIAQEVFKRTSDFGSTLHTEPESSGFHENYSTKLEFNVDDPKQLGDLLPHLITRQLYVGTGDLTRKGYFPCSARVPFLTCFFSQGTQKGERGIICTRDEPHTSLKNHKRFHLISGEPARCPGNRLLTIGTMCLVMDMAEDGVLPFQHDKYHHEHAIEDIRGISLNPLTYDLQGFQKRVTAFDIQNQLCMRATIEYHGRDEQTDVLLRLWKDTLNKLVSDPFQLVGRLDRITKEALFKEFEPTFPACAEESTYWVLRGNDQEFTLLNPATSLFNDLRQRGILEEYYHASLISSATYEPPRTTRAHFRGNIVQRLQQATGLKRVLEDTPWSMCRPAREAVSMLNQQLDTWTIDDPLEPYHEALEAYTMKYCI